MKSGKRWFLYLIECVDGSIYTGITVDVERRYSAHCAGTGARYTRSRRPAALLGFEEYADRATASSAEYAIKRLSPLAKRAYAGHLGASTTADGRANVNMPSRAGTRVTLADKQHHGDSIMDIERFIADARRYLGL